MRNIRRLKTATLRVAKRQAETVAIEYAFLGAFIALVSAFIISMIGQ